MQNVMYTEKSFINSKKKNSNWIELIVKDNFDFTVKLQYSKKMRVSDINYDIGDNLFIYALIISSEKTINHNHPSMICPLSSRQVKYLKKCLFLKVSRT